MATTKKTVSTAALAAALASTAGVPDKGGKTVYADADEPEEDEAKADADAGVLLNKVLTKLDAMSKRMDAFEEGEGEEVKADKKKKRKDAEGDEDEPEAAADDDDEDPEAAADDDGDPDEVMEDDDDDMPGEPERVAADKKGGKKRKDAEGDEPEVMEDDDDDDMPAALADSLNTIQRRIASVEKMLPKQLSDKDFAKMADAQAKADEVFQAFGDSAPRPLNGEDLGQYRRRLAGKLKAHSKDYAKVNLGAIYDRTAFEIAERSIYADAMAAAMAPVDLPAGHLREVKRRDHTGLRMVSEFRGSPSAWMAPMQGQRRRLAGFKDFK